ENWIGRSEGAEIHFPVSSQWQATEGSAAAAAVAEARADHAAHPEQGAFEQQLGITVFTTRPDTIFGATFMVLAPEHPVVDWITAPDRRAEVEAYRTRARAMDLVARKSIEKAKTGVFTGATCRNPATGEDIPV